MKNTICVINRYTAKNFGDRLIGNQLKKSIIERGGNVLMFEYTGKNTNKRFINTIFRILKKINLKPLIIFLKVLLNYQFIKKNKPKAFIIGGGQLLLPNDSFPFAMFSWILIAKKLNIPVYFFSVGIERKNEKISFFKKILIKCSLKKAKYIWLRDLNSQKIINKLIKKKWPIIPDVIYLHNNKKKQNSKFTLIFIASFKKIKNDYKKRPLNRLQYYNLVEKLIDFKKNDKIIISNSSIGDIKELNKFYYFLSKKRKVLKKIILNEFEFLNLMKNANYIISSRMHPLLFAHSMKIDFKAVPLNLKTKSMEELISKENKDYFFYKINLILDKLINKIINN